MIRMPAAPRVMMAVAALIALTLQAAPANAANTSSNAAAIQKSVADVLRRNPGARQIDATTVLIHEGAVFHAAAATCANYHLCLYKGTNNTGAMLDYSACYFENIGLAWGNDQLRSIQDNQTSGVTTNYYNYWANPAGWRYVGYSVAKATYFTVSAAVQTTEGVQVC